jgi:hypothetical protein
MNVNLNVAMLDVYLQTTADILWRFVEQVRYDSNIGNCFLFWLGAFFETRIT